MKKTMHRILAMALAMMLVLLMLPAAFASAPTDPVEIVKEAYALKNGKSLSYTATLSGKITAINTAYDSQYKNVTVTIIVEGAESMPIMCYRMKGTGAEELAVGYDITVTGKIKNYSGTIEFDAGCTLDSYTYGEPLKAPTDHAEIVKAAYALEKDRLLPYTATLIGTITKINDAYSSSYKNISVTIAIPGCEDMPILCYRMKGTGANKLAVGDVIAVTGTIKNYNGTVEFDSGCTFVPSELPAEPETPVEPETPTEPETPVEEEKLAYAQPQVIELDGKSVELQAYALKDENGLTNYVKLRDIAYLLNGSAAQFEVTWDGNINLITGKAYTVVNTEMISPFPDDVKNDTRPYKGKDKVAPLYINSELVDADAFALTNSAGDHTYFKLRDLGKLLNFNVGWAAGRGIFIETDKAYTDAD